MGDSVLGVGRTQWGLIVSWMWGVKESVESKLTPGFGLSEEEVSIKQDNARKYRHLLFSHQVLSDCLQPQGLQHAVSYHVLEFAQVCVHCIGDAIQPSHPLWPSSPSAFNLSQHQGLFQWVSCLHQVAKVILESKKRESVTASPFSPSIWHEAIGSDAMIFVFLILSFQLAFSLSSIALIKRPFSSSSLSAIRVISSAYLRLLIFLPVILSPACSSSSPAFYMICSANKLNTQVTINTLVIFLPRSWTSQ